jgi:single-strand DNA-binding protein
MASMNKVILLGNLGQDPDIKNLPNGGQVANLSIATSETWKDKNGERQERTQWHRVVVWSEGLVKVIDRYLAKGDQIMVVGQLETRSWESEGVKKYATEVVLRPFKSELQIIRCKAWNENGGGNSGGNRGGGGSSRDDDFGSAPQGRGEGQSQQRRQAVDDDIPF